MLTTILPQIIIGCSAIATAVYLAAAKQNSPITRKDANIIWKLHKQTSLCNSHKMQPLILKNGDMTGFQCQCGYRYIQKRPLLSRTPANLTQNPTNASKTLNGTIVKLDQSQL
jgi:hypothetical protein